MDAKHIEFLQDVLITMHMDIRELQGRKTFAEPQELTYIEPNFRPTLKSWPLGIGVDGG